MNVNWKLLAGGFAFWAACTSLSARADEPKSARVAFAPNAAGIYWQAFSALPTLKEEQRKTLDAATSSTEAPLSDELKPIVDQFRVALHELHRARNVAPCDWQLDMDAGPELRMPHLQKARELSRIALLRARQRFAAGENDAALSDILAVFKMARDCSASPILISLLVDMAIEKSATEVLAGHLPLLKPAQLDQLATDLQRLPEPTDVATAIRLEEHLFGDWLDRRLDAEAAKLNDPQAGGKLLTAISVDTGLAVDLAPKPDDQEGQRRVAWLLSLSVAEVRESLKRLRSDYAGLGVIAALPVDERTGPLKTFEDSLAEARKMTQRQDALRVLSTSLLPAIKSVVCEMCNCMSIKREDSGGSTTSGGGSIR